MAALDRSYSTPLASITSAVRDNKAILENELVPESVNKDIDLTRWNKLYPYALVMAEPMKDDWEFLNSAQMGDAAAIKDMMSEKSFYTAKARFVLPIPPEQLTIQTPYAIQVSKTLGGVVEEHNADPFKIIAFTGTTGVNPLRANSRTASNDSLFGGIVDAAAATASAAKSVVNFGAPSISNQADETLQGTGYAQFRLLEIFLQSYVRAKKEGNKNLRLLFIPYKDQTAYIVTPMQFTMRREAGRALKYRYDIQLKAWKEIPSRRVITGGGLSELTSGGGFAAFLAAAVATLDAVRKTIAGVVSIVKNVRAAVNRLLDIVRQIALAIKEAIGAIVSIIDLPGQIIKDCKQAFRESAQMVKQAYDDAGDSFRQAKKDLSLKRSKKPQSTSTNYKKNRKDNEDVGALDKYFDDPTSLEAINFLSLADISKLTLPTALSARIQAEKNRVANFTNEDYSKMRSEVRSIAAQLSDGVGASSSYYDTTYQNVHATVTRIPTQGDWDALFAVNDTLKVLNRLSQEKSPFPTTMEYVAGFASKSGVAFQVPTSKYPVPFPYDYTLEEVARQYLGNPDRWVEIAALNGLRAPYVDEVGFTLPLLGNGKLSEVLVGSHTNLTIGQAIWLQSNAVNREKRHILNIEVVGPNNVILTLDGLANLDKFLVTNSPYIQAFLPDTVNSHQVIYIPSDKPAANNETLKSIPGVDAFDSLLEVGGIDMLLTSDNDLAITQDGDCRLAYGMANLVQRARVVLSTPRGALIRHPNFGLPVKAGMSVADLDINELKVAVSDIFTSDPSFDGTTSVSILQNAGTLQIGLGLAVTGQDHPIAVNFQVKR
jgi:hypothetical protein